MVSSISTAGLRPACFHSVAALGFVQTNGKDALCQKCCPAQKKLMATKSSWGVLRP
jgi:hypothetical protein